jgi:alpha-galactosidase/6-phospho-beta-glucosidase family protein
MANPLVGRWEMADALLTEILAANQNHLPRFAAV